MLVSHNPSNNQLIKNYEIWSAEHIESALERARTRFEQWQHSSAAERAQLCRKLGELLKAQTESWAQLCSLEMGKNIKEARAEIKKCVWVCEYYAEHAERFLRPELHSSDAKKSLVSFRPLGAVLGIMPWNFPFWQVFRFAIPTIMAGNVACLKHASNVTGCALGIEQLFLEAGFPAGVMQTFLVPGKQMDKLITDPRIKAVSLTGSTEVGRTVASLAGQSMKRGVYELGGSDPYVVLADADLELAVKTCLKARFLNAGQSCISAKRLIVEAAVYDQFVERMQAQIKNMKYGDALDESLDLGPMARADLRDQLHGQVTQSIAQGAKLIHGGVIPKQAGAYYPATLLIDAPVNAPAFNEELFGPVAVVIKARHEKQAIELANQTCYGLGAAVFTQDLERGQRIAEVELQAGSCFVNNLVQSDPRLPFGGIKDSGYGRELSLFGIREFTNIKTVCVF